MNKPYTFETKESNEVAYLWARDEVRVKRAVPRQKGRSVTVYFTLESTKSKEEVEKLRRDYYNNDASVDPHKFVQRQCDVKTIICGTLDEYNNRSN